MTGCAVTASWWPSHASLVFVRHVCALQLANEQAQNLEAATAAEERIQALERRLASQQDAALAHQAVAAGEPPAMAAPGTIPSRLALRSKLPPTHLQRPPLQQLKPQPGTA